jgi:hypothetical protein
MSSMSIVSKRESVVLSQIYLNKLNIADVLIDSIKDYLYINRIEMMNRISNAVGVGVGVGVGDFFVNRMVVDFSNAPQKPRFVPMSEALDNPPDNMYNNGVLVDPFYSVNYQEVDHNTNQNGLIISRGYWDTEGTLV